jgi:hypothetical protein
MPVRNVGRCEQLVAQVSVYLIADYYVETTEWTNASRQPLVWRRQLGIWSRVVGELLTHANIQTNRLSRHGRVHQAQ